MAKYKNYNYSQNVLIPVSLEDQLIPGTLEFAIHTLVETRMNTSIFDCRYDNDETGRLGYDPKILSCSLYYFIISADQTPLPLFSSSSI
jgi:hypothetical protein